MEKKIEYSVIIPVYRGENTLIPLVEKITNFFISNNYSHEIILIYDCGPDNSWEIIKELQNRKENYITAVRLSRNFGQHNALICGFSYAKGSFFVTMDEDGQHDPEDIKLLVNKAKKEKADVVYGKYQIRQHSILRNFTSYLLKKLLSVGLNDLHPDYSSFRLIRREIALATLSMNNSYTFLDGYITWITKNVSSVIVNHNKRTADESSYTLKKLIDHSINIFITFSILPIRIVTFSSFVFFLFSLSYAIYLSFRKIFYSDLIPGFASVMILSGLGIGLILLSLGIIGEYLYRINLKTTQRPNFFVTEVLNKEA